MNLDELVVRMRTADRAEDNDLGREFRAEVMAQITRAGDTLSAWQRLLLSWLALVREPRWALAVLVLSSAVALGTSQMVQQRTLDQRRDRDALSLTVFDPFAPFAPERLVMTGYSNKHE